MERNDTVFIIGIDFDKTISEEDTCKVYAQAAMEDSVTEHKGCQKELIQEKWEELAENYAYEYEKLKKEFPRDACADSLSVLFEDLRVFERRMNAVFEEAGLLKGLSARTLTKYAKKIQLQNGSRALIAALLSENMHRRPQQPRNEVHIVSCSWSRIFIEKALDLPSAYNSILSIHANELKWSIQGSKEVCVDGKVKFQVQDPLDKAEVMNKLKEKARCDEGGGKTVMSVFIGDSLLDLCAMLTADIGLIVGENGSLIDACNRFGVKILEIGNHSLSGLLQQRPMDKCDNSQILYKCRSWGSLRELFQREGIVQPLRNQNPARILCISGSDSGGGAGNQADLKVCSSFGMFGMSAFTALTAQNTQGVRSISPVSHDFVAEQIDAVLDDIGVDAVKTGVLATKDIVSTVSDRLMHQNVKNIVVDPVLIATSGDTLAKEDINEAILKRLFPVATIVTPNIPEAEILLGWEQGKINDIDKQIQAAIALHQYGSQWVLVKGGHLEGDLSTDVLYDGKNIFQLTSKRIKTKNTHGTGCTLGTAIACGLAGGLDPLKAVKCAKIYLSNVISQSRDLDMGSGIQKPLHHHALKSPVDVLVKDWNHYRLYAVTDSKINVKYSRSLVQAAREAIEGGATIIQIREKEASTCEMCEEAMAVVSLCKPLGIPVIINDRVDVAIASDADGVHIGDNDLPLDVAREMIGPLKILGVSVKSVEQAKIAQEKGADYVGAGGCFPTTTKLDSEHIGLETVRKISENVEIPVVAIGGINMNNAKSVVETGVAGVAVVSAIFDSEDVKKACKAMRQTIDDCWH